MVSMLTEIIIRCRTVLSTLFMKVPIMVRAQLSHKLIRIIYPHSPKMRKGMYSKVGT